MVGEGGGDEKWRMRFAWRSPRNALPIFAIKRTQVQETCLLPAKHQKLLIVSLLFDIYLVSVRVRNERWFLT